MKNKKGQLLLGLAPFAIIIVLALVILIGAIAFLASPDVRYVLIGVAIMGATFVFAVPAALQGDFTKNKLAFLITLFLIGLFVILLPKFGLVQEEFGLSTLRV